MDRDHLKEKIRPYDPTLINTVEDALVALEGCSFQGRNLGRALETLTAMVQTKGCLKVLTLSGAMIPAGMEVIINRGIEQGVFNVIVTTGANIIHSIVNCYAPDSSFQYHFLGNPKSNDEELYKARINRIYDTLLPEQGYTAAEDNLLNFLQKLWPSTSVTSPKILVPSEFFRVLGENLPGNSFLSVAANHNVPIFCGATSDSELGLNLVKFQKYGKFFLILDELKDIENFAQIIQQHETYGTIILGGGVPRNWAQQIFPYLDQTQNPQNPQKFDGYHFSVRFHTAVSHDGGLSGCTISESISWGKYSIKSKHQSVWVDSTIGFPLVMTALLQRLQKEGLKKK